MTALGLTILALAGLWLLGGIGLRLIGAALFFTGPLGLVLLGDPDAILLLALGAPLWLAGHWHYGLRHQTFKSSLARYVFCRWAPSWLDPTWGWALAVSEAPEDRGAKDREWDG
jgi:hypothetical protein